MPIGLFDVTFQGLEKALDLHQQRHEVLASNLANVETPGYQARDLEFRDALASAFVPPEPLPAAAPEATVAVDKTARPSPDGNSVDIDLQMAKLSANSGRYNALARIIGKRFALLRQAIDGVH